MKPAEIMEPIFTTRRELVIALLLSAVPVAASTNEAHAAPDPAMTIVKRPDQINWVRADGFPSNSVEQAPLWSKPSEPGLYLTLVKWYPGYMSAPHWYETDRYCVVVSGTWWVASGDKFDAENTVAAPAGSFVRRVARTPHYDGVKQEGREPAIIAICGMGPIAFHGTEEGTPRWRKL